MEIAFRIASLLVLGLALGEYTLRPQWTGVAMSTVAIAFAMWANRSREAPEPVVQAASVEQLEAFIETAARQGAELATLKSQLTGLALAVGIQGVQTSTSPWESDA